MNLFLRGPIVLHSGRTSELKIDCDALSDDDLATLAFLASKILPLFGSVDGVPTGGLRLAWAMASHVTTGPVLICDDVLTTGDSMERQRDGREAIGLVLFTRGPCPPWITALCLVNARLWEV